MSHTVANKKPLLARVRRLQGQMGSLERALEADTECAAVLQQIAAVRGAVNGLMTEVLEDYLRTHLMPADGADDGEQEELIKVVRTYLR